MLYQIHKNTKHGSFIKCMLPHFCQKLLTFKLKTPVVCIEARLSLKLVAKCKDFMKIFRPNYFLAGPFSFSIKIIRLNYLLHYSFQNVH